MEGLVLGSNSLNGNALACRRETRCPAPNTDRLAHFSLTARLNGIRKQQTEKTMADRATPLPQHDVPSLPATPEPKRTKYTEPAANLTVACTFRFPHLLVHIVVYPFQTYHSIPTPKLTQSLTLQQSLTPPNQLQPPKPHPSQIQWLPPANNSSNKPNPRPPQPSRSNSSPKPPKHPPAARPLPQATTSTPQKPPPSPPAAKCSSTRTSRLQSRQAPTAVLLLGAAWRASTVLMWEPASLMRITEGP